MPICPAGHNSVATDFCDTCGLPITEPAAAPQPSAEPEPLQAPAALVCPQCGTPNVQDALFCEACGHDFIGGASVSQEDAPAADGSQPEAADADASDAGAPQPLPQAVPVQPVDEPAAEPAAEGVSSPQEGESRPRVEWVAELWIDPDWYAAQGSTDPLPSPGLPDIVPLVKQSNLIGRISRSRNIFPEIDCELDNGTSRRHARLSTDGSRWWIEDLDSANGTFVGSAAGPLPAMPIPRGRTELGPDQRIYVGAWTRIVIRRATGDEQAAFAGEPI